MARVDVAIIGAGVTGLASSLCVRGRALLYEFCAAHGVPHERCGKLVPRDRRNARVVHAAGIDSPGLTASLAIGDLVSELVTGG